MYESLLARVQSPQANDRGDGLRALVSAPGIADNPVVTQLYTRLIGYQTALDSMTTGAFASSASNPDVRRLNSLIASTRVDLQSAVRGHVESVRARLASLDELKGRATADIQGMPTAEAEEVRLTLQLETAKKLADQLREEYQKARVAEAVEAGQVEVLTMAQLPSEPVPSHRGLKIALALILGISIGTGGAFLREHMNQSIGRKEDIDRALRIPTLGVVPRIVARANAGTGITLRRRAGGLDAPTRLVTALQQNSSSAEAYRTLRTNLIFSQSVQSLSTIVVTSSSASEGKTTTAANLAVAFAQQGKDVLLVDCDLRRPRMHRMFSISSSPGLTELVLNHLPSAEVVRKTAVERLSILPAGKLPPNPSELLGSDRMRTTLGALSARYEVVILDTPPMLAAADAAVLGSQVDGVLLVIRAGKTDQGAAQYALQQLHGVGARVIGAVLNDPDAKVPTYGGYYGYYDSTYGHRESEQEGAVL
jgi:polysaccharide biosynthesis transport protein